MIQSFRCKATELLFKTRHCHPRFKSFQAVAERKLDYLDMAEKLSDLKIPPNNHLEALKRDRVGQHSIRINKQFRICFIWTDLGPTQVEIVDYH